MDPLSTAIIAAVTAGLVKGIGEVGQTTLVDAYKRLKGLMLQRFGDKSDVVQAIQGLEARPDSAARKELLVEEITRSGADRQVELLAAARDLLAHLPKDATVGNSVQQAIGHHLAQADRQSHAEVNVNAADKLPS
jgi:hypothetical protein